MDTMSTMDAKNAKIDDTNIIRYIWLSSVLSPGSTSPKILLEYFGDIDKIYSAEEEEYLELGINAKDIKMLADKSTELAEKYYAYCKREHIGILLYENPYYPQRLKAISNPPPLLYYRGRVEFLDDHPCFAMVGTRSCSENGYRHAYRTAYKAASYGAVIVNGLALGIDSACICASLDADAYAVGVLGCGIDRIYPTQNKDLFYKLSARGLIISEFPPFSRPDAKNFPIRNRVISGLSVATVIFEASSESGALHTAANALSQGRKLYAVPGNVFDSLYEGPLGLIKCGANMITDAEDFISEYSLMFPHRINIDTQVFVPERLVDSAVKSAFTQIELKKKENSPILPKPQKMQKCKEANASFIEKEKADAPTCKPEKTYDGESQSKPEAEKTTASQSDLSMLSAEEKEIYMLFEKSGTLSVDELTSKGIKIDDALSSLTLLEVYGFIEMLPGGRYKKINI